MKLLFCALNYPPGRAGGAERQARLLAEALVRRGHDVHVVCPRVQGLKSDTTGAVRVVRLPVIDRRFFRTVTYLPVLFAYLLVTARNFDLIHVHLGNLQADVVGVAARLTGVPYYLKIAAGGPRGEIGRMKPISFLTRYWGVLHASAIQAISQEIARDTKGVGVPESRIRLIPNGVALPPLRDRSAERRAARVRCKLPLASTVVLYVGRMEREKGAEDLIDLWRGAFPPDARLVLIGSAGLNDPVAVNSLPRCVEYRPWSADPSDAFAAADIFVLPSYVEGMSNSLLEAMAMALAIVATRVGAAEEMIDNGVSGLLIPPGDHAALRNALERLIAEPGARERMGKAARQKAESHYDIEAVAALVEDAYQSVLLGR